MWKIRFFKFYFRIMLLNHIKIKALLYFDGCYLLFSRPYKGCISWSKLPFVCFSENKHTLWWPYVYSPVTFGIWKGWYYRSRHGKTVLRRLISVYCNRYKHQCLQKTCIYHISIPKSPYKGFILSIFNRAIIDLLSIISLIYVIFNTKF